MSNIISNIFSWFEGESDYSFATRKEERPYVFAENASESPIFKKEAPAGMPENLKLALLALGGSLTFGVLAAGFGAGWHFASLAHVSVVGQLIPTPPAGYWIGLVASTGLGVAGSTAAVAIVSVRNHHVSKKIQKEEHERDRAETSRKFQEAQNNNPWRKE